MSNNNITARINNNGKLIIVIDPTVKGELASSGKSNILASARWLDIGALDGADDLDGVTLNLMLIKKLAKAVKKATKNAAQDDDEDELPAEAPAGKRKSRNVAQEDDDAPAAPTKRKTSKAVEEAPAEDDEEVEKMLRQQRGKLRRLVQGGGLPEAFKNLKAYAEKYFDGFDEDNMAEELKAVLDNEKWLKLAETLRTEHKLNFKQLVEKKLEELGESADGDDDNNAEDNNDDDDNNSDDNNADDEIDNDEVVKEEQKRMRGLIKNGLPEGKTLRGYAKKFFSELEEQGATVETFQALLDDDKWMSYAEKLNEEHDIDMQAIVEKKIEELEDAEPEAEPEAKPTKKPLAKAGKKTASDDDDDLDFTETKTKTKGNKPNVNKNAKGNVQPIATSKRPADKVKTKRS